MLAEPIVCPRCRSQVPLNPYLPVSRDLTCPFCKASLALLPSPPEPPVSGHDLPDQDSRDLGPENLSRPTVAEEHPPELLRPLPGDWLERITTAQPLAPERVPLTNRFKPNVDAWYEIANPYHWKIMSA